MSQIRNVITGKVCVGGMNDKGEILVPVEMSYLGAEFEIADKRIWEHFIPFRKPKLKALLIQDFIKVKHKLENNGFQKDKRRKKHG